MRTLSIGERRVGDGAPCLVVAEAGSNHDGSLEQALRLVEVAARAGADAVKFQTFRAARLYPRGAGISAYLRTPRPIYDIIHDMEMPSTWIPELAAACRARDVVFFSSPFDEASVDLLEPYVDVFKIASYEMTHAPLVRYVARAGKPVIMSTGTATLDEVRRAVGTFRETGNDRLILLQCTASYPAPLDTLNLRALVALKREFDVPTGLSDHSRDPITAPIAATALGADVIEKHFTLSNDLPGPDHAFAVQPDELALMVERIRDVERALGTGEKVVHPVEEELRAFARRSIFATRAIAAGERLSPENVAVLRCGSLGYGLAPDEFERVLGRPATRAIAAESLIRYADLG